MCPVAPCRYPCTAPQRQSPDTKELWRYKVTPKLTKTQREVIVGLLLGDGSMQTQNRACFLFDVRAAGRRALQVQGRVTSRGGIETWSSGRMGTSR